jgi:hypothetical protein
MQQREAAQGVLEDILAERRVIVEVGLAEASPGLHRSLVERGFGAGGGGRREGAGPRSEAGSLVHSEEGELGAQVPVGDDPVVGGWLGDGATPNGGRRLWTLLLRWSVSGELAAGDGRWAGWWPHGGRAVAGCTGGDSVESSSLRGSRW